MRQSKEWPDSVLEDIDEKISMNAPIRSISVLIPFESVKFGKDCIELLNAVIRKLYRNSKMKLGDRIVGTESSTHQILQGQRLAGELKKFSFLTKEGEAAKGNATAHKLGDSVGAYVKKHYGGSGVSIFGVSALDGYHSMLLTYDGSMFQLIDQGPATSFFTGKVAAKVGKVLDNELSDYVRGLQDKRVGNDKQYELPATIEVFKIYPSAQK